VFAHKWGRVTSGDGTLHEQTGERRVSAATMPYEGQHPRIVWISPNVAQSCDHHSCTVFQLFWVQISVQTWAFLTEVFCGFPQSCQVNTGIMSQISTTVVKRLALEARLYLGGGLRCSLDKFFLQRRRSDGEAADSIPDFRNVVYFLTS
jgi:hypothetical protein